MTAPTRGPSAGAGEHKGEAPRWEHRSVEAAKADKSVKSILHLVDTAIAYNDQAALRGAGPQPHAEAAGQAKPDGRSGAPGEEAGGGKDAEQK